MKKRSCERFTIPGATLYYKDRPRFFGKNNYSNDYYPVINMSKGGANFLCGQRLKAGTLLTVKVNIPGVETEPEIMANVRWVSRNPEQSYRYQAGIAFNSYGDGKNKNSKKILSLFEMLEIKFNKTKTGG